MSWANTLLIRILEKTNRHCLTLQLVSTVSGPVCVLLSAGYILGSVWFLLSGLRCVLFTALFVVIPGDRAVDSYKVVLFLYKKKAWGMTTIGMLPVGMTLYPRRTSLGRAESDMSWCAQWRVGYLSGNCTGVAGQVPSKSTPLQTHIRITRKWCDLVWPLTVKWPNWCLLPICSVI